MKDFQGAPIEEGEIIGVVYYSGTLSYAVAFKCNENGCKIRFKDSIYIRDEEIISRGYKAPSNIVKLNGIILDRNQSVCLKTGIIL